MAAQSDLIIFTDGASRGNPGAAACAYTIELPTGEVLEEADRLGTMTNNQAEYTALVRALEHALQLGPDLRVVVHSDSELMVKQMRGEYKVKNEDLRGLYEQATKLARQFRHPPRLEHVRRADNKRADQLCNDVLDGKREASVETILAEHSAKEGNLHDEAEALLDQARAQPSASAVWDQLVALLQRHGMRIPARKRGK
ncbi:MAG: ribonuclease HI family protein [Gemmataceae bacterium]